MRLFKLFISFFTQKLKFLRNHNEELTILIAVAVFFFSPYVLRFFDPTAGVYDAGVLQLICVAIIAFSIFQSFNWLVMRIVWPSVRSYFENHFVFDFNTLTPWQKVKASLSIYFLSLLFLVLLFVKIAA
jgi:hypothetical protein